jgi:hypothetical protein
MAFREPEPDDSRIVGVTPMAVDVRAPERRTRRG